VVDSQGVILSITLWLAYNSHSALWG